MGHKVHPVGFRIGINRLWDSRWYASKKKYAEYFHQDLQIQKMIQEKLKEAGVSKIEIHRTAKQVMVIIHTSRPGIVIGSQGKAIEELKAELHKNFKENFQISVHEIKKPYQDAYIIAEMVGKQVERRIPYRRACKMAIEKAMEAGALGAKILISGRLNGVEISRAEYFTKGKIPLHTMRSDIDYAFYRAITTYGTIGVKVWIYKGEIFKKQLQIRAEEPLVPGRVQ